MSVADGQEIETLMSLATPEVQAIARWTRAPEEQADRTIRALLQQAGSLTP